MEAMDKRNRPMHRTTTSAEVKNRWNAAHYDRVVITVPIGARDEIQAAAKRHGMSVAAYIRMLVIHDNAENPENTRILRGGGVSDAWEELIRQRTGKPDLCYDLDADPDQLTLDGGKNAVLSLHEL